MNPTDNAHMTLAQMNAEDEWHRLRNEFYTELLDDDWDDGDAWREAATLAGDAMDNDNPAAVRY